METFAHMNHLVAIEYLEVDTKIQMGDGWAFTSESPDPNRRIFTLTFNGYKFYEAEGGGYDAVTNQYVNNMKDLVSFYETHRTHAHFIYDFHGAEEVEVRFAEPLKIPKGIINGGGALESFTIKLEEMLS